jgi:fatty-acid peroxygenase
MVMTDLAVLLHRHGYDAIDIDRQARDAGPTYRSRLLGRRAVVLGGVHGAKAFYDESLVERRGAVPAPLAWLIFGRGAVHGLDDDLHRDRKLMFLEALSVEKVGALCADVRRRLEAARAGWAGREVSLHDELVAVYGGASLSWAGIDLPDEEAERLSRRLAAIIDGFGFTAAAYSAAWRERLRVNHWAAGLVRDVRAGKVFAPSGSAVAEIAHNDQLDARTAGVELVNVLRPTVAVSWLGTFAGAALADHPEWRRRLADGGAAGERYAFAEEVRRTTPFAPALAGKARRDRRIEGLDVRRGDRLVLDVIGIDHDPAVWTDPNEFRPDRFLTSEPGAFEMVPQGGGHPSGHRCPGESIALGLLAETARVLAATDYDVTPPARPDRTRIPTLPQDGLRLRGVRLPVEQSRSSGLFAGR